MRKKIFCIEFFLCLSSSFAQKYTISGYVSDFKNGEKLLGASVFNKQSKIGTITNPYGFYSLTLLKGKYEIVYSQVGYGPTTLDIDLIADTAINIELNLEIGIEEVTVLVNKVSSKNG